MIVVSLDPFNSQECTIRFPTEALGTSAGQAYLVHDLLSDQMEIWQVERNRVALDPQALPARICRLKPRLRREQDFDYYM